QARAGMRFADSPAVNLAGPRLLVACVLITLLPSHMAGSHSVPGVGSAQPPTAAPPLQPPPQEALGRSTPRGTVLGFLSAGRKGDYALARQYLGARSS